MFAGGDDDSRAVRSLDDFVDDVEKMRGGRVCLRREQDGAFWERSQKRRDSGDALGVEMLKHLVQN